MSDTAWILLALLETNTLLALIYYRLGTLLATYKKAKGII